MVPWAIFQSHSQQDLSEMPLPTGAKLIFSKETWGSQVFEGPMKMHPGACEDLDAWISWDRNKKRPKKSLALDDGTINHKVSYPPPSPHPVPLETPNF